MAPTGSENSADAQMTQHRPPWMPEGIFIVLCLALFIPVMIGLKWVLDPIARWGGKLVESGAATAAQLEEISTRVAGQVADAVAFCERSEPADTELVFDLMFAGQKP